MVDTIKNHHKVFESLKKYKSDNYKHYFVIEYPKLDDESLYYVINYVNEFTHYDYLEIVEIEVYSTKSELYLIDQVNSLKQKFNLPIKKWERKLVDYC